MKACKNSVSASVVRITHDTPPSVDIIKDGFDAGVRLAEAVPRDMIAMPLGPHTRHVVVGAPSYFANRPRPIAPGDLMNHECIRTRFPAALSTAGSLNVAAKR
jgi:DNA-binding transcriptional LysR family regulator